MAASLLLTLKLQQFQQSDGGPKAQHLASEETSATANLESGGLEVVLSTSDQAVQTLEESPCCVRDQGRHSDTYVRDEGHKLLVLLSYGDSLSHSTPTWDNAHSFLPQNFEGHHH